MTGTNAGTHTRLRQRRSSRRAAPQGQLHIGPAAAAAQARSPLQQRRAGLRSRKGQTGAGAVTDPSRAGPGLFTCASNTSRRTPTCRYCLCLFCPGQGPVGASAALAPPPARPAPPRESAGRREGLRAARGCERRSGNRCGLRAGGGGA